MRTTTRTLLLGLTAAAVLGTPAVAAADSIVYLDHGDVFSARPDGSGRVQLTTGGDWHSPTQSDDGTIAAVRGASADITVMAPDGRPLRTITTGMAKSGNGETFAPRPVKLALSPDASKIAYSYVQFSCGIGSTCGSAPEIATLVTDSTGPLASPLSAYGYEQGVTDPEWATPTRLILGGRSGTGVALDDIPSGDFTRRAWIDPMKDVGDPELSRDGRRVAFTFDYGAHTIIAFARTKDDPRTAAAPQLPDVVCTSGEDAANSDPTWSPDGSGAAFAASDGITVVHFATFGTDSCTVDVTTSLTPTGSEPDWGPSDPPPARFAAAEGTGTSGPRPGTTTPTPAPVPTPPTRPMGGTTTTSTTPAPASAGELTLPAAPLTLRALRRGTARLRLRVGRVGVVRVRVRSGRSTITTGRADVPRAGTVVVRLRKPTRTALATLRGRRSVLVAATLSTPGQERVEDSQTVRVR